MNVTFTTKQKELLTLLSSMQPICNKRTTLSVTETVLFQITPRELTLKATDLEISLQSTMAIESNSNETTSFLIPGKRIFDIVKEMDGEILFSLKDSQLHLSSNGVDLALNIKDSSDFPPFPERIENMMGIEGAGLLKLLNKVAFLIPQNNANNALNGMLLEVNEEKMSMVATDGHCLAKIESSQYSLNENKKWLIPKRAVMEVKKLVESNPSVPIFLGMCGNQLVFSGEHFNFFTKLIADAFPQYEAVMDKKDFVPARLARDPFVKTLKRTGCLLSGQFVSTSFTFSPGIMNVKLYNKDVGKLEENIALEAYEADPVESRFYSPYLLNGLHVFPDEQVNFYIKSGAKPIIFETETEDYHFTYLVMPISMSSPN